MSDPFLDEMTWRDECANDASGNGPECEHQATRINLQRCTVQCLDCGEDLLSLNVLVDERLRVRQ